MEELREIKDSSSSLVKPASLPELQDAGNSHSQSAAPESKFSEKLLNVGFGFALVLAILCLVFSALYLNSFLNSTTNAIEGLVNSANANPALQHNLSVTINARLVITRVALQSCGVFVGMAFGFLGFALFLIGIKGEIRMAAGLENSRVKIARMSPGVFVILCSVVLIAVCVSRATPFSYENTEFAPASQQTSDQSLPNDSNSNLPDPSGILKK